MERTRHVSGMFEYKAREYVDMNIGLMRYTDCVLLCAVGEMPEGTAVKRIDIWFDRLEIELNVRGKRHVYPLTVAPGAVSHPPV